jgi:hypothetical protein
MGERFMATDLVFVPVRLTDADWDQSVAVGNARNKSCRDKKHPDGAVGDSLTIDPLGAFAELALSRVTGLPWWTAIYTLPELERKVRRPHDGRDVGHLEVRATINRTGSLLLKPHDPDHVPFVLAIVLGRIVSFAGWCYARDGKQKKFWRTDVPKPAFFVGWHALQDMRTLPGVELRR